VGINMPARTVVISSMCRPFGGTLTPNEFSQLTGRAGRRGIDERGAVVLLPERSYSFEEAYHEVCEPLQPIQSAFQLRYSTLLSAMEGSEERLDRLVRSSLRQYQMKGKARRAEEQLEEMRRQLMSEGFEGEEEQLREYLELQYDLSLAEKEQKRAKSARAKSPRSAQAERRHARAKQHREELARRLRAHPSHGTAILAERENPERLALLRRMNKLASIVREAQRECDQEAADTASAVRTVLVRLGYVRKQRLTPKADGLREIVAPSGIVLSELYQAGAFADLTAAELAEAISWFACDVNRRRENFYRLPRHLEDLRREALRTFQKIAAIEEAEGVELAQAPSSWFYGIAYAWCRGETIQRITARVEIGEGDVVSVLNKTVDLLEQFESMVAQYGDAHLLALAAAARRLLVRGLVAMMRSGDRLAS
jgi:ATP-dependent RNA helicase HelY